MPDIPPYNLPVEQSTLESVSLKLAQEIDFQFFKDMNKSKDCLSTMVVIPGYAENKGTL